MKKSDKVEILHSKDKMFAVQVLVVLSAMVIINQAAVFDSEGQTTTSSGVVTIGQANDVSETVTSDDFSTTQSYEDIIDTREPETNRTYFK
ncbi:uncharacterized protein LOC111027131 [Myzus persicae]|uniref:uncharacterized protein LOC111027131 n=1 Tax=Myzus persicae TaxID=13164 RepID=UPI000B939B5D|nr:uncharacterized protein LOC111027131 [Myzus persicae]